MKGKVKFFNDMKGFGFIAGDDGKEYFVHQTGLKEGVTLKDNDDVTFDVTEGDRGPKAENVELASAGSSEEPAEEESSEEPEEEASEEPEEESDEEKQE
ncbi:hypothetical protein GF345_06160 [Candidatus Woesearchaeota archaeon]|nr:hypothetical protein [Candidatus Woesearchaeota archaeon]